MKQLLIGIGSSYGDDQLGWMIIDELSQKVNLPKNLSFYKSKSNGTDWYSQLTGHDRLVFIDAQISSKPPGSIIPVELDELNDAFELHSHSSHGISLSESILLADNLGLLNVPVMVFGISVGGRPNIHQLSGLFSQNISSIANELLQIIK